MCFEILVRVTSDEQGNVLISHDVEDDGELGLVGAVVELTRVEFAPVEAISTTDVFENGFFPIKEDELDTLGRSFVVFKNSSEFDEESRGRP